MLSAQTAQEFLSASLRRQPRITLSEFSAQTFSATVIPEFQQNRNCRVHEVTMGKNEIAYQAQRGLRE
jgi:hypothetical protein